MGLLLLCRVLLDLKEVASEGERRVASVWKSESKGVLGLSRSGTLMASESSPSSRSRVSKTEGLSSCRNVEQGAVL